MMAQIQEKLAVLVEEAEVLVEEADLVFLLLHHSSHPVYSSEHHSPFGQHVFFHSLRLSAANFVDQGSDQ